VHIHNRELIASGRQYIFISNHASNIDPIVAAVSNRNYLKYIGKAEVLKLPVFGYILKALFPSEKRRPIEPLAGDGPDAHRGGPGRLHLLFP